ncbi:MAG: hypothetical protein ACRDST_11650 [Pseudonocardiaceae bacterium]
MSATVLRLTVEPEMLDTHSCWPEARVVGGQMGRKLPGQALASVLEDAQERLIDSVCGPQWAPVRGFAAPFVCPRCGTAEDFVRKSTCTRRRKLRTAVGTVDLAQLATQVSFRPNTPF